MFNKEISPPLITPKSKSFKETKAVLVLLVKASENVFS